MCDQQVQTQILSGLAEMGEVMSDTGRPRELREIFALDCSNTAFKRALGCAIRHGWVARFRPPAEGHDYGYEDRYVRLNITPSGREHHRTSVRPDRDVSYFVS